MQTGHGVGESAALRSDPGKHVPHVQSRDAREAQALRQAGVEQRWQRLLFLPTAYDDITAQVADARLLDEKRPAPLIFRLTTPVSTSASRGVPRASFGIRDRAGGQYRATIFGNPSEWAARLKQGEVHTFLCVARSYGGQLQITCKDHVEPQYVGRVRPVYAPGKTRPAPPRLRELIAEALEEDLERAAAFVTEQLACAGDIAEILARVGCAGWTLEQLLTQVHAPRSLQYAQHAHAAYLRLAALGAIARMHATTPARRCPALPLPRLAERMARLPVTLTADQARAVTEVASLLERNEPLHHIISGDVGTGKTYAASVIIGAVIDANPAHRVLVMVPNVPLAAQFQREFEHVCPDIATTLVTGSTQAPDPGARVVFGTSAVLHRKLGSFTLVVVDEQQRWSRAQRERYCRADTHLLELSATCIPRTQALVRFGRVTASEMRQSHRPKNIHTRLWEGAEGTRKLLAGIRRVIAQERPVVVVYPKREASGRAGAGALDPRHSIEAARERWEKAFPGQVIAITGDDEDADKQAAICALETGAARVLLCTLVVEVGLNVKGLRNIVIVHPDRYGLATLHQLRGRVARDGGEGYCELLMPEPANDKVRARLEAVLSTTDGFVLSELDLKLRGTGDLGRDSATQAGADRTFLFGVPLTGELLESVEPIWAGLAQHADTR